METPFVPTSGGPTHDSVAPPSSHNRFARSSTVLATHLAPAGLLMALPGANAAPAQLLSSALAWTMAPWSHVASLVLLIGVFIFSVVWTRRRTAARALLHTGTDPATSPSPPLPPPATPVSQPIILRSHTPLSPPPPPMALFSPPTPAPASSSQAPLSLPELRLPTGLPCLCDLCRWPPPPASTPPGLPVRHPSSQLPLCASGARPVGPNPPTM
jgi:hypothetical protein